MGAPAKVDLRVGGDYFVDFHGNGESGCRYTFVHNGLTDRGVDADEEGLPAGWHEFFDRWMITSTAYREARTSTRRGGTR